MAHQPDRGQPPPPGPQPVHVDGAALAERTFYDAVGGEETFRRVVAAFYARVPHDPVLSRIYDLDDLAGAEERLRLFLIQYWGGPRTYSETRGHPRLRMRHVRFRIDAAARDAWLAAMAAAIDEVGLAPRPRQVLWDYLTMAADSLVNAPG